MSDEEDIGAIVDLLGKAIQKAAKNEPPEGIQLSHRISEVEIETSTTGASFIKLQIIDPDWELQTDGWLSLNKEGLLQQVEIEFPEESGWFWRLCAVDGTNIVSGPNLTLTMEDRIVAYLRDYWGPKTAPPGTTTRAQFVRDLVREVGGHGEGKIRFVCPAVDKVQPIEPSGNEKKEILETKTAEAEHKTKANKEPGLTKGAKPTIKGAGASAEQIANANILLSTAVNAGASQEVQEAIIFAGIAESGLKSSSDNGNYWGVLAASHSNIPQHNTKEMAEAFLHGGKGYKSALDLAKTIKNPAAIASQAEGAVPYDSSGVSEQYKSEAGFSNFINEAKTVVETSGFAPNGNEGNENKSDVGQVQRGTTANPDEDSWDCIQRLAQQVNWRCFTDGNTLFYITDPQLRGQQPALFIDVPANVIRNSKGEETEGAITESLSYTFDNTTFEYRKNHKQKGKIQRRSKATKATTPSEVRFSMICGVKDFRAGEVFVFENSGCIDGRWIVVNATRNVLADTFTQFVLAPPTAPLPEPKSQETEGEHTSGTIEGYRNPFKEVTNLTPARIDMGVDYAGTGNVTAIGNGTVTFAQNVTGWEGGGCVVYTLADGPFAGKHVYVAENVTCKVKAGDKVTPGQVICSMAGGIETGWASGNGDQALAASLGQQAPGDPGSWESKSGESFNHLLEKLGVTSGTKNSGGKGTSGQPMPPGFP